MVVLAPTGIAAINAGGVTIHSFFQLPLSPYLPGTSFGGNEKKKYQFSALKRKIIRSIDLLVIDEISMVRSDLLDAIDSVLRRYRKHDLPFGGVQLLMIGDLHQLAPVVTDHEERMLRQYYDTPYFFSSKALQQAHYITIELKKVYRQQDQEFISLLNQVRENKATTATLQALNKRYIPDFIPPKEDNYIRLTTHNAPAQRINEEELEALPSKAYSFTAEVEDNFPESSYPADYKLVLKQGAQIMFVKNDVQHRFYNGMIGEVVSIDGSEIVVRSRDTDEEFELEKAEWANAKYTLNEETKEIEETVEGVFRQYPVRLAWAITIHKSQGLTFDHAIIDVQRAFTHGQTYVALSRCRTLEGMVLSAPLPQSAIIRDEAVDEYATHAIEHTPSEGQIEQLQRDYYLSVVSELFDFRPLMDAFNRVLDLLDGHFRRSFPKLIAEYKARTGTIKTELMDVAERFKLQYSQIVIASADYQTNALLQERLKKVADYFARKITDVEELVKKTSVKTENKDVKKRYNDVFPALKEVVMQKRALLNCVKADGFTLHSYLRQRALVLAGKTISEK